MILTYRPATPDDRAFIVSGWSSSLRTTRDVPLIAMEDWADIYHPVIEKIIDRAGTEVIIAAGSVLAGFVCFERPDYVYYCYVAQPFRGRGVARTLFERASIDPGLRFRYACRTRASWQVHAAGKIPLAEYDPFHARFPAKDKPSERDPIRQARR